MFHFVTISNQRKYQYITYRVTHPCSVLYKHIWKLFFFSSSQGTATIRCYSTSSLRVAICFGLKIHNVRSRSYPWAKNRFCDPYDSCPTPSTIYFPSRVIVLSSLRAWYSSVSRDCLRISHKVIIICIFFIVKTRLWLNVRLILWSLLR